MPLQSEPTIVRFNRDRPNAQGGSHPSVSKVSCNMHKVHLPRSCQQWPQLIPRKVARDPSCYHNARLSYPQRVFDILQKRCRLRTGTRTFEIGPGTGLATKRLLQLGASPPVGVEPDKRLANFLSANFGQTTSKKVKVATFERVKLRLEWFDLGVSSAFHWVNEKVALRKIVRNLRQGGWWAMWWNLFSDGSRADEFHKATRFLLQELDRSSPTEQRPPCALDREQRIANVKAVNAFENIEAETISGAVLFG
jgi:hypothetical protein